MPSRKTERIRCVLCGRPLTEREVDLCTQQKERFDKQMLCSTHQHLYCGCPGIKNRWLS